MAAERGAQKQQGSGGAGGFAESHAGNLVSRKAVSHPAGMNRRTRQTSVFSKVSVKSQTAIPREVRERLRLRPGDTLRYRLTEVGILLDKAPASEANGPFATFSEWLDAADAKAYGGL